MFIVVSQHLMKSLFGAFICSVVCIMLALACLLGLVFFFQAEDGIRDLVRSRGLGDVYKRQVPGPVRTLRKVEVTFPFRVTTAGAPLEAIT